MSDDPKTRYERGLDALSTISGSPEGGQALADFFQTQGALGDFVLHVGAGEIWARDAISRRDRSLIVISFLAALGRELELPQHIGGGLNHGLERDEIDEIMVQLCAYVGAPFALTGARLAAQVFAERDGTETRQSPPPPAELKDPGKRRSDAFDLLRTLLAAPDLDGPSTQDAMVSTLGVMGELTLDFAFGDVWTRPQLSRRDRSMVVVSALTALNLTHELEIHIGGALNHGVTRTEIEEIMMTAVLYCGFPRAIDGMHLALKVFGERDGQPGDSAS